MYIHIAVCVVCIFIIVASLCIVENTDDFFKVTKVSKVLPGLGIVAVGTKKCKIIN